MGISGTLTSGAGVADSLGVGGVTQPIRSVTISRVATMDEVVMDFDEFIGCLVGCCLNRGFLGFQWWWLGVLR